MQYFQVMAASVILTATYGALQIFCDDDDDDDFQGGGHAHIQ